MEVRFVLKEIKAEAVLEDCRVLIDQINAELFAEEPFVNVSQAADFSCILSLPLRLSRRPHNACESVARRRPQLSTPLTAPRLPVSQDV